VAQVLRPDIVDTELIIEEGDRQVLAVRFTAMHSPCELLLHGVDQAAALALGRVAATEAWRIERKFSRYRDDSVLAAIHASRGTDLVVDEETAGLLDFARECFEFSDGRFDITSGVLRQLWRFDGSDRIPDPAKVQALLPRIGFGRLRWERLHLLLPEGMELDFGGIGKEYAVDRAFGLIAARAREPFLLNFGGDLRANRSPPDGAWQVGIERPDHERDAALLLDLTHGALATSGDSRRFLLKDGVRYGHVLDPRTGWPVPDAPRSATVAASSCTEAGILSTLALLHGRDAEAFLAEQGVRHWVLR
jgi:thiamine biosynthesis lipoprotein